MINYLKKVNKTLLPRKYLFSPEWIVLGVNNVCNLHCKMCDVGTKNLESNFAQNLVGTHPINMPLDLIKKVIDQTQKYYPTSKLAYAFTEPLVYPHLIESLLYAKEKKVKAAITTNALTLKIKAEKLSQVDLDTLYVSIDGPQEIHNEIRGHKKSFQKAIEGIELFSTLSPNTNIEIICAITEWNIGYLKTLLDAFKNIKISKVGFMHTQFISSQSINSHNNTPWGVLYAATDSNMDLIDLKNVNTHKLFNEINEIENSEYPFEVYFSPKIKTKEILDTYYKRSEKILGKYCYAVYTSVMIKSDGSVIPAHGRCYNLTLGNIYKQTLKEVWQGTILKKLRTDLHKAGGLFPACSRCCSGV